MDRLRDRNHRDQRFTVLVLPGPRPPRPPIVPGGNSNGGITMKFSSTEAGSSAATVTNSLLQIERAQWSGGNLVLSGRAGPAGAARRLYYLLESTNLALPLAEWTRVATNSFNSDGTFRYETPRPSIQHVELFYTLELP